MCVRARTCVSSHARACVCVCMRTYPCVRSGVCIIVLSAKGAIFEVYRLVLTGNKIMHGKRATSKSPLTKNKIDEIFKF